MTQASSSDVHLLVLVHGMWGNPGDLAEMARIVKEERPELHVLLAETNKDDSTYDGIDWGGERVAKEVLQEIASLREQGKRVRQFSITGYSLGGLVSRYVAGVLLQRGLFSSDSPESMTPVNFNTIATPHLGLIQYSTFFSSVARKLGPKLLSRTGEQFYCVDKWGKTERPILDVMSDPNLVFYQALEKFKHIRIYANCISDLTVPYVTAAIETEDPFAEFETNGLQVEFHPKHSPILTSYSLPPSPPAKKSTPHFLSPTWFRNHSSSSDVEENQQPKVQKASMLPPFLQFRFPFNVLVVASIPLLIPSMLTLAAVRLSIASRSSKARISVLEKESSENGQGLVHALTQLEKQMEDVVADFIDNPGAEAEIRLQTDTSSVSESDIVHSSIPNYSYSLPSETSTTTSPMLVVPKISPSQHPILSPLHKTIATRLNRIPHLKKERAFIEGLRNTHSTIISRDPKIWDKNGVGLGVLRHWAGQLVVE